MIERAIVGIILGATFAPALAALWTGRDPRMSAAWLAVYDRYARELPCLLG